MNKRFKKQYEKVIEKSAKIILQSPEDSLIGLQKLSRKEKRLIKRFSYKK